jgi:carbonic anhydrase/acetyltransferase-like protein (isoleucine patch superfamily)
MFYSFKGVVPQVSPKSYVHPSATVIGAVVIDENVYVGPGAVLRGDWGKITIHRNANIQENCVVHSFPNVNVVISEFAHIGHGAVIHGAHLGKNCLIGMNAVIMDNAVIEENAVIGALSFVPSNTVVPSGMLAVGNPVVIKKALEKEFIDWKITGTEVYIDLARIAHGEILQCEPNMDLSVPETKKISTQLPTYSPFKK